MNDMELFTLQDNRNLEQMLADYEEEQRQYQELMEKYEAQNQAELSEKYQEMSQEEKDVNDNYWRTTHFLAEANVALHFAENSTKLQPVLDNEEHLNGMECVSLLDSPEAYAESLVTLTGGFDEKLIETIDNAQPFLPDDMEKREYDESRFAPRAMPAVENAINNELTSDNMMQELTVADMRRIILETETCRATLNIDSEYVVDDTRTALENAEVNGTNYTFEREVDRSLELPVPQIVELYEAGYTSENVQEQDRFSLTPEQLVAANIMLKQFEENDGVTQEAIDKATKEIEKEDIPVTIVESSDGYVMNTSQEITAENETEYARKVENGNEVIHNEAPTRTTIDTAEVGGNVKLEEFDDIGTEEKADGELTYEEKADIADDKRTAEENKKDEAKSKKDDYER